MSLFDKAAERRNTDSLKWDVAENELPMWVADMDYPAAPAIRAAIEGRAASGVFGYAIIPERWKDAYIGWWQERHHLTIERDWLLFTTGVVPAISSMVRKLTTPAEKVLLETPVYNIFFNSIKNNGRVPVESPLKRVGDTYEMDWQDLAAKLADPELTLLILCNPQNPGGILWSKETLARLGDLCAKNHVTVISDEIHCDLTAPGLEYTPFAAASDTCRDISVTCLSPSKAFNVAGLHSAAVFAADPVLRHKVRRAINTDEVAEPNVFAIDAAVAAYTKSGAWLDELRAYLHENKELVRAYLKENLPAITMVDGGATYLAWLDCRAVTGDDEALQRHLRRDAGLYVSTGSIYGAAGRGFLRLNLACPRATVTEGLARLQKGIDSYRQG